MTSPFSVTGDLCAVIKDAIETQIEGSSAVVTGGGGHYTISVTSAEFEGKSLVNKQRLVYRTIRHLMDGADAPLHAVDKLETLLPASET